MTYALGQRMTGYDSSRVAPFGHLRVKACLAAHRRISLPTASFIASWRQGIHQMPLNAFNFRSSLTLFNCQRTYQRSFASGTVDSTKLVEVNGIEPMAPCVQGRCSPS